MAGTVLRRPLPALISLLALLLLTAIVWWRVLNRDSGADTASDCPTPTPTPTAQTLPAPAAVQLQVLNSTTRSGIAGAARRQLMEAGFDIPTQAANDRDKARAKNTGTAQIRYGPSGKRAASLVRYYLPGADLVATDSTKSTVVVALGAKYRSVASKAAVAKAIKGDRLTVASAAPTPAAAPSTPAGC